jgi:hypothetical protein
LRWLTSRRCSNILAPDLKQKQQNRSLFRSRVASRSNQRSLTLIAKRRHGAALICCQPNARMEGSTLQQARFSKEKQLAFPDNKASKAI